MNAQAPGEPAARRAKKGNGLRGPAQKELIYVTLPGSLERSPDQNGNGIVVLDAKNNYNFVKRIPVFDVPASQNPEQIAGVTASPVTQMIYVAARGRLAARGSDHRQESLGERLRWPMLRAAADLA